MAISASNQFREMENIVRDDFSGSIVDPLGRSGEGSGFVMTSFPERDVVYPVIIIKLEGVDNTYTGLSSVDGVQDFSLIIKVYGRSVKERDGLADQVVSRINVTRILSFAGNNFIFGVNIVQVFDMDEEGKGGVHVKVLESEFSLLKDY